MWCVYYYFEFEDIHFVWLTYVLCGMCIIILNVLCGMCIIILNLKCVALRQLFCPYIPMQMLLMIPIQFITTVPGYHLYVLTTDANEMVDKNVIMEKC